MKTICWDRLWKKIQGHVQTHDTEQAECGTQRMLNYKAEHHFRPWIPNCPTLHEGPWPILTKHLPTICFHLSNQHRRPPQQHSRKNTTQKHQHNNTTTISPPPRRHHHKNTTIRTSTVGLSWDLSHEVGRCQNNINTLLNQIYVRSNSQVPCITQSAWISNANNHVKNTLYFTPGVMLLLPHLHGIL